MRTKDIRRNQNIKERFSERQRISLRKKLKNIQLISLKEQIEVRNPDYIFKTEKIVKKIT
jgi:hypothetical protein